MIEGSRDLDLESVKRLLQANRKVTRQDEREIFEGQYLSLQPSLDGSHVQVNGRLGPLEADICRQGSTAEASDWFAPARHVPTPVRDEHWRSPPYARTNSTALPNPPRQPPNASARPATDANRPSWL